MAQRPQRDVLIREIDIMTTLSDGTRFPQRVEVMILPYALEPAIEFVFQVVDGHPEIVRFAVVGVRFTTAGRPVDIEKITAASIHAIKVGELSELAIERVAKWSSATAAGSNRSANPVIGPGDHLIEGGAAGLSAVQSYKRRRGPITDDELAGVAEIVQANPYDYRQRVAEFFPTSLRTASRYVALARERGLLDDATETRGDSDG